MKNSVAIASFTLSLLIAPAGAQLAGQLGVLDPQNANGGINPATGVAWASGDQYRLAFHTEDKRDALSTDIADYNAFVNTVADGSVALPNLGDAEWKVLGSTETVSARVNTGTETNDGIPIFVLDGTTLIALDSDDMWNGFSDASGNAIRIDTGDINTSPHYSPYLNEEGAGDTGVVHGVSVATGTNSNGTIGGDPLGNVGGSNRLNWGSSNANRIGRVWARFGNGNPNNPWSFYALSEPLMVTTGVAPLPFAITEISYAPDALPNPTVTLTWRKTGAESYIARISRNLSNWGEDLDDSIAPDRDENLGDTDHITVTFALTNGLENEANLFFRIEEPPAPQ